MPQFFQASQALGPRDVPVIEYTVIVGVAFYVGNKALVAVEFQRFIGHARLAAYIIHAVHVGFFHFFNAFTEKVLLGCNYRAIHLIVT